MIRRRHPFIQMAICLTIIPTNFGCRGLWSRNSCDCACADGSGTLISGSIFGVSAAKLPFGDGVIVDESGAIVTPGEELITVPSPSANETAAPELTLPESSFEPLTSDSGSLGSFSLDSNAIELPPPIDPGPVVSSEAPGILPGPVVGTPACASCKPKSPPDEAPVLSTPTQPEPAPKAEEHPTPPPRQERLAPAPEPAKQEPAPLAIPPAPKAPAAERPEPAAPSKSVNELPKPVLKPAPATPKLETPAASPALPKATMPKPAAPKLAPPPSIEPPKPATPKAKPGSLTVDVTSVKDAAAVGDDVVYEVVIQNQGESPIESVEMTATLSENLKVTAVTPAATAEFKDNTVTFKPIKNFMPMQLKYTITAKAERANGGSGRITVEVKSDTLGDAPLKDEAVTPITVR